MSEKNEKDPTSKKKLNLPKELIENLKDEDLDKVTGGGEAGPGTNPPPSIDEK